MQSTGHNDRRFRITLKEQSVPYTTRNPRTFGDNCIYMGSDQGNTGTPPCGKSRCYRYLKDIKHTRTLMNGRSPATHNPQTHSDSA